MLKKKKKIFIKSFRSSLLKRINAECVRRNLATTLLEITNKIPDVVMSNRRFNMREVEYLSRLTYKTSIWTLSSCSQEWSALSYC